MTKLWKRKPKEKKRLENGKRVCRVGSRSPLDSRKAC